MDNNLLYYSVLVLFLAYFTYKDIKEQRIPNKGLIVFCVAAIVMRLAGKENSLDLIAPVLGIAAGALPMLILYLVSKGNLGFGDVKLFGVLGLWLGVAKVLWVLALTFVTGAIYGVFILLLKKGSRNSKIPLVPFILIGTIGTISFWQQIQNLFLSY